VHLPAKSNGRFQDPFHLPTPRLCKYWKEPKWRGLAKVEGQKYGCPFRT
jgi:hypothetical protein